MWSARLLLFAALAGACDPAAALVSPPLASPWADMKLPPGGDVLVSEPRSCSITWPRGEAAALADTYVQALEREGWSVTSRRDRHRTVRIGLQRGSTALVVSVIDVLGVATVTLELRKHRR